MTAVFDPTERCGRGAIVQVTRKSPIAIARLRLQPKCRSIPDTQEPARAGDPARRRHGSGAAAGP
jgi:hypothetical protein